MYRLLYPGSFCPITLGHMDIIQRAALLCDELVVAVLTSDSKTLPLNLDQRKALAKAAISRTDCSEKIKLVTYDGLMADLCRDLGVKAVVRGLRYSQDYAYEVPIAEINRQLLPGLETIFLQARPELAHVSSSLIREMLRLDKDYKPWLPEACWDLMDSYLARK